jgi:FixJ family two-component response regulator
MSNSDKGTVFIIDDDEAVRRGIALLLKSAGYKVESYTAASEFLETERNDISGCILLDVFMNGESGLELQDEIALKFRYLPVIYISGQGNIPMSVQALKKGAINFLQKPIDDKLLFEAVDEALANSYNLKRLQTEQSKLQLLVNSLTPRESEVFRLVITGILNKQIAAKLNIAEHTVKLHRGKITEKLGVKSAAEMATIAEKLNLKEVI